MNEEHATGLAAKKEQLALNTERYKQAIEEQVDALRANAGQVGKTVLIAGGTLLVTYLIVQGLTSRRGRKKREEAYGSSNGLYNPQAVAYEPKRPSMITKLIIENMSVFLLGLAGREVKKLLASLQNNDTNADTESTYARPVEQP